MILTLVIASILTTYSTAAPQTKPSAEGKLAPLTIGKYVYEGGDGSSAGKAVIIRNARNETEGMEAESKWIEKVHPGWKKGDQSMRSSEKRKYDKIEYTTPQGGVIEIYFDITDFFGKR
jgi:hypothetical protein